MKGKVQSATTWQHFEKLKFFAGSICAWRQLMEVFPHWDEQQRHDTSPRPKRDNTCMAENNIKWLCDGGWEGLVLSFDSIQVTVGKIFQVRNVGDSGLKLTQQPRRWFNVSFAFLLTGEALWGGTAHKAQTDCLKDWRRVFREMEKKKKKKKVFA